MFLDEAQVQFISGRGGSGAATFHREKHVPRGGPNGADGGRGGDVILIADRNKRTLYDFKLNSKIRAEDGQHAIGNKKGKDGRSVEVKVPVGTVVYDNDLDEALIDLNVDGMKFVICRGGKGGFGNLHYTSSVRQAPNIAQKGAPGEMIRARLELKLLADVGLIGMPNAGKSTLISRISSAKPKIADYPFTTIQPNLGVVGFGETSFTVADLPGLILGASEGKGLGHQFLRHVERTSVLIHVIDTLPIDESDPIDNYRLIENELRQYSEELFGRPRLIALNKIDLLQTEQIDTLTERFRTLLAQEEGDAPIFPISGVSGQGLDALLHATAKILEEEASKPKVPIVVPAMRTREEETWEVEQEDGAYFVKGRRVERLVAMTNLDNYDSVRYMHRTLDRMGVIDRLRELGAQEGDTVKIGEAEFAFAEEV